MKLTVYYNGENKKVCISDAYQVLKDYDNYLSDVSSKNAEVCVIAEDLASSLLNLFADDIETQLDDIDFNTCVIEDEQGYRHWE